MPSDEFTDRPFSEKRGSFHAGSDPGHECLCQFWLEPRKAAPRLSYKASTRDGTWSNGAVLHNGSVPNLYELLLPASESSKTFYISRDFDPVKLGVDTSDQTRGYY